MSARIKGLTITLDRNVSGEGAEEIMKAIRMIKGVVSVAALESDPNHWIATESAKHEIRMKVYKALE